MKIHPLGADLFYADRQTDRHDETNSLRNGLKRKERNNKSKSRTKHRQREKKQVTKRRILFETGNKIVDITVIDIFTSLLTNLNG